ncbi:MAG: FtsX-like permease family protein, partial [Phycisphaerae bacterium]
VGETLRMSYYVEGEDGGLAEHSREFRIKAVVPLAGPAGDATLMPEFPGLADVDDCRDWRPGVPIDLSRIREKNRRYWDEHGGTPKVFVNLQAGRDMWENRFGELTAVRWPGRADQADELADRLAERIDPGELGLYFQPVRARALQAVRQGQDFGQLFLGFSMFLIGSAVVLTGLLFVFDLQQRRAETGTLLALGLPGGKVRRLMLAEGATVAAVGAVVGAPAGIGYTAVVAWAMETFWPRAVARGELELYVAWTSPVLGAAAAVAIALAAMWLTLRRQTRTDVRELLAGAIEPPPPPRLRRLGYLPAPLCVAAAAFLVLTGPDPSPAAAARFFIAGVLLLAGIVVGLYTVLGRLSGRAKSGFGRWSLAVRNVARRRGRSTTVAALLACASFMVVAVGANRLGVGEDIHDRHGPAGGFELLARSSMPIAENLHTADGRRAFGLDAQAAEATDAVPFRVQPGDEASCLNIGRAQRPRLLAVRPEELDSRGAFSFTKLAEGMPEDSPWSALELDLPHGEVPAIGDQPTLRWSLNKGLGETVEYTDENGRSFRLRIVGVISSSVLQGNLLISQEHFLERFGSTGGYGMALIDAPPEQAGDLAKQWMRAGEPVGLEVVSTADRLAELRRVENTYLSIFQILGGLGLLLGTASVGVVTARNVLERRNELALLRAVGHPAAAVRRLVIAEHWLLLTIGIGAGAMAGLAAVVPAIVQRSGGFPAVSLALTLAAILAGGLLWTCLAAAASMRGDLLPALRNE